MVYGLGRNHSTSPCDVRSYFLVIYCILIFVPLKIGRFSAIDNNVPFMSTFILFVSSQPQLLTPGKCGHAQFLEKCSLRYLGTTRSILRCSDAVVIRWHHIRPIRTSRIGGNQIMHNGIPLSLHWFPSREFDFVSTGLRVLAFPTFLICLNPL